MKNTWTKPWFLVPYHTPWTCSDTSWSFVVQFCHCTSAVKIMFSEVNISHNTYVKCVFSSQWLTLHAEKSPAVKVCSASCWQVTFLLPFLHWHIVTCPVSECSLCCNSSFKQVSAAPDIWSYLPCPTGSLIC